MQKIVFQAESNLLYAFEELRRKLSDKKLKAAIRNSINLNHTSKSIGAEVAIFTSGLKMSSCKHDGLLQTFSTYHRHNSFAQQIF